MNIKVYTVNVGDVDVKRKDNAIVFAEPGIFTEPKRQANMYVALAHRFVKADVSVYLAGNIILKSSPEEIVNDLLGENDIAVYKHYRRDCIYAEAGVVINSDKGSPGIIYTQMERYRKDGYPEHNGLAETGMIIRRHN